MRKPKCPMSEHGVVEQAVQEIGGVDEAAVVIDRPKSFLYGAMNPDRDPQKGERIGFGHMRALVKAGARAPAEDLARLAGCLLVPMGEDPADPGAMIAMLSSLLVEVGEAVQTGGAAAADGKITPKEAHNMKTQLLDVVREATGLLARLEGCASP